MRTMDDDDEVDDDGDICYNDDVIFSKSNIL